MVGAEPIAGVVPITGSRTHPLESYSCRLESNFYPLGSNFYPLGSNFYPLESYS